MHLLYDIQLFPIQGGSRVEPSGVRADDEN